MLRKLCLALAVAAACLLGLSAPAPAQKEKKAERSREDIQQERLRQMMTAYNLAAQGREKNAPEYLITAADLLHRLSTIKDLREMKELDAKVEVTGGDNAGPPDKASAVPSLAQQAEDLFKEASDMGAALNVPVDRLIKVARERATDEERKRPEGERAVIGGPRYLVRSIGAGQIHHLHVTVMGNQAAQFVTGFGFAANAPMKLSVVHGDSVWVYGVTMNYEAVWRPGGNCNLAIRVQNLSRQPAMYQMFIQ